MKKYIKSYLAVFIILTAVLVSGCDIFESFQFGLPVRIEIETLAAPGNILGSQVYRFDTNETYQKYEEDINSINYVAAYIVTLDVSSPSLTGTAFLRLYEYNQSTQQIGSLLFEHIESGYIPSEHDSTNAYKVNLTPEQVTALNQSLNNGNKAFYGEYEIQVTSGGLLNYVKVRIDALFNVDAKLD